MKKRNQNGLPTKISKEISAGFGLVEALLIIIAAGIVGFGGYYIWHNQRNTKSTTTSTSQTAKTTTKSMAGGKFVFKELKVQITLPDNLKDLSYTAEQGTSVTGAKTTFLYLSSTSFAKVLKECYSNASEAPSASFGALGRVEGQYPHDASRDNTDGALLKQFPSFYIDGSYPNGITTCDKAGAQEKLAGTTARNLYASLVNAFKTATVSQ